LQREILSLAWRGRRSETALAALLRLKNELWPYLPANKHPIKSVDELFPGIRCHVQLREECFDPQHRHYYRVYMHQTCVLAAITAYLRPKRIFEFGTHRGKTTVNLALNSGEDCEFFTLDLPLDQQIGDTMLPLSDADLGIQHGRKLGELYEVHPAVRTRITQLYCDSAKFDSEPYANSCDLIYIDAGHTYEYVANDSRHALRMLRRGGVIIWDDYCPPWPGVVKSLQEEAHRRNICQIEGTEMAIYIDQEGR
jgi:predicted O-methyltransferase YrrM